MPPYFTDRFAVQDKVCWQSSMLFLERFVHLVESVNASPMNRMLYFLTRAFHFLIFQGLCKLGSTGGGTVNDQTFAEGATLKLYKSVRRCV